MHIGLYFEDGTPVSEEGTFTNAVEVTLRLDLEEVSDPIRLYAQADEGYEVTETEVQPIGTSAARWQLAPDIDDGGPAPGAWEDGGDPLVLGTVGDGEGTRVYFWVRADSLDSELVQNDTSVVLRAQGIAAATD